MALRSANDADLARNLTKIAKIPRFTRFLFGLKDKVKIINLLQLSKRTHIYNWIVTIVAMDID